MLFGFKVTKHGRRLLGHALAVLLTTTTLTLAGPAVARADAASLCAGRPTKTVAFPGGELRLYRSRQYVCATTVATHPGARRAMSISLQPRGGHPAVDTGRYTRQAGPITVHALNRCVRATGAIAGRSASTGWVLC